MLCRLPATDMCIQICTHSLYFDNMELLVLGQLLIICIYIAMLLCFNYLQEAAWTISNITAGQPHQIQAVIDAGLVPGILDIMIKVSAASVHVHVHACRMSGMCGQDHYWLY